MNCCRETVNMTWQHYNPAVPQGSETYLNGTLQRPTPEEAGLPASRAYSSERKTAKSAVAVTPRRDSRNIQVREGKNEIN